MSRIAIYIIVGYQLTIGRMLPRVCRFEPTCSAYAIEALRKHGFFKGILLSAWRLFRCNPFFAGGLDPVPRRSHGNG